MKRPLWTTLNWILPCCLRKQIFLIASRPLRCCQRNRRDGSGSIRIFREPYRKERFLAFARLCENTVHGSTRLTTNGVVSLEIEYLSVRPEHRRRAPREFSHSLSFEMTMLGLRAFVRNQNPKPQI